MRLKRLLGLSAIAWIAVLPPAISATTSCSSQGDYELKLIDTEGITFTNKNIKVFMNQDLYIPFTIKEGKQISGAQSTVSVNADNIEYNPLSTVGKYWTIMNNNIIIWKQNLTQHRKYNNNVYVHLKLFE